VSGPGNFEDELKKALDAVEPAFTGIRDRLKSFEPKKADVAFGLTLNVKAGPVRVLTAGGQRLSILSCIGRRVSKDPSSNTVEAIYQRISRHTSTS
jgi:hypothetical protein